MDFNPSPILFFVQEKKSGRMKLNSLTIVVMVSNLFWVDGGRGGDLALCYSHRHNLEQEHCAGCDDERKLEHRQRGQLIVLNEKQLSIIWHQNNDGILKPCWLFAEAFLPGLNS